MSPRFTAIEKARKDAGLTNPYGLMEFWRKDWLHLSNSIPQFEYDLDNIPENVFGVGAIIPDSAPASEIDPDLDKWLNERPTVLVNLGTHFISDPKFITNMSKALARTLASHEDIQVLWKVQCSEEHRSIIDELLSLFVKKGRIRVLKWLKCDPVVLLQTGNIVLSVNHGGGNSFWEGLW